ncbi:MAG: hypothetical protein AAFP19_25790 [Bacteroidota bacterium]
MKSFSMILCTLALLQGLLVSTNQESPQANTAHPLEGTWELDLRPTPDAAPYFQELHINKVKDRSFQGQFYGSPIKNALINNLWEETYIAFKTSDRTSTYYHYAKIKDQHIEGMTYCIDRQLAMPWRGVKK